MPGGRLVRGEVNKTYDILTKYQAVAEQSSEKLIKAIVYNKNLTIQ